MREKLRQLSPAKKKQLKVALIQGGLFLGFLIAMAFVVKWMDVSIDDLLKYQPKNKFLAALLFLLFYGIKSVTVFMPVPMLYLAVGHFFTTPIAIIVNFLGIGVAVSIPYVIGRYRGVKGLDVLFEDQALMTRLNSMLTDTAWFSVYMIRMCQVPMDLVSAYLGSKKLPYWQYLIGSLLGMAPSMIGITVIGSNITHPDSPVFVKSVLFMVAIIAGSFMIFHYTRKKHIEMQKEIESVKEKE